MNKHKLQDLSQSSWRLIMISGVDKHYGRGRREGISHQKQKEDNKSCKRANSTINGGQFSITDEDKENEDRNAETKNRRNSHQKQRKKKNYTASVPILSSVEDKAAFRKKMKKRKITPEPKKNEEKYCKILREQIARQQQAAR